MSGIFLDRLRDIRLPSSHVIRIDGIRHNAGIGLLASGADAGQESSLRHSRVVLREAMGITQPDFLQYRFHITLAYLLRWLDDDLAAQVGRDVRTFLKEFLETAEEIRLGPAEFCNFENMHEFRLLRLLDEPAV